MGWMTSTRAVGALLCAAPLWLSACGSDEPSACGSDADCKGERICVAGECIDPGGSGGGGDAGSTGGGADGGSGGSGGGSTGPVDDDELEAACMMDCIEKQDAGCGDYAISLDQCRAQCLVVDEQSHGYCLAELRDRYDCLAKGGYSCINGYPQPRSTCIEEQTAYSECVVDVPCRHYCDSTGGGCASGADACLTQCLEDVDALAATYCNGEYGLLLNCWGNASDFSCDGSRPEVGGCGTWVARTGDCIGRRADDCDGYCWAADALGCGDGCLDDCTANADDVACGFYWDRVIDCAVDLSNELELECVDGAPQVTEACASDLMEWQTCMGG